MRSATRTVVVSAPALVVVAVAWLRLEQPLSSLSRVLVLLVLALVAAVPRRGLLRAVGAVTATLLAGRVAVGVDLVPWRLDHAGSILGTRFGNGFDDFYGTPLPFDPRVHVAMGELVLSGIFVFALGITLLVAAREPVASALVLLLGAGWPATLLGPSRGVAMGAAILCAALFLLAGLGSRRITALALPAAAVVATAAVVVGSASAARHGLVHWQTWNLAHVATGPEDVGFVWNAQYGGLKWSGRPTTVLQVESDQPPTYLRAAVLDDFSDDAWATGQPRPADSLEPAAARKRRNQTRETVTVNAFADTHLVGGSIPIRFAAGGVPLVRLEPGFAALNQNLPHGFRYTVWSYIPRPTPAALRRSSARYPSELEAQGLLDVGDGSTLPRFGAPRRASRVLALVGRDPALNTYLPLARLAEQLAGSARTPYGAVSRLENWFVASNTFRYTNHPQVISPPLVSFVTQTHAGYCQYFAGAMALMLRYLGIPARVAVGFAGGSYDRHERLWNVSDREAHAWVEVWFKGYGWLPIDPTPAAPGAAPRQTLAGVPVQSTGSGVTSSEGGTKHASAGGTSRVADNQSRKAGLLTAHARATAPRPVGAAGDGVGSSTGGSDRGRPLLLLLALLAAVAAGIVLTKVGVRMIRSVRRDPRAVASACRAELTSFLVDQRIDAPSSATLGDLGELLKREFGVAPGAFVAAATLARFGPPEDAAIAAVTARQELRALLDAARRGLTRRERLRGLFSLRSLTRPVPGVDASAPVGGGIVGSSAS